MKQAVKAFAVAAVAAAVMGGASSASAYQAGDVIARVGAVTVQPHEDSSDVTLNGTALGANVGLDNDTQLGLAVTYMVHERVGIELLAATPFSHNVSGSGALAGLGINDVASVKHLPPTLSAQYYFADPACKVQPYVGLGVNYTVFFDEDASSELEGVLGKSSVELDDSVGLAGEIGLDAQFDDHWALNVAMWYVDIDTTADIKTPAGRVKTDVEVDPLVYMVGVAYKF